MFLEVYQTRAYARSCGQLEGDAEDGDCVVHNDNDLFSGIKSSEVCYCTTDLCNEAASISVLAQSTKYFFVGVMLFLHKIFMH